MGNNQTTGQRLPDPPPNRQNNGNNRNENRDQVRDPRLNINPAYGQLNNNAGHELMPPLRNLNLNQHNLGQLEQPVRQGNIHQDNQRLPIRQGNNQDNRRPGNIPDIQIPPIRPGNHQDNQRPPIRPGNNQDIQIPPIRPGNHQDNQRLPIRPGNHQDNQRLPIRPGNNPAIQRPPIRHGNHRKIRQSRNNPQNEHQPRRRDGNYQHYQEQQRRESDNQGKREHRSGGKYFGFNYLTELGTKDSDEVITALAKRKDDFEKFLNDDIRPDMFVLTIQVLTNLCQANFAEMVTSVLSNACSAKFLKTLHDFLVKLPFETDLEKHRNKLYHEDKNKFWCNLSKFFKKVIELLPNKARDELAPILERITKMLPIIEENQNFRIDENVKNDLLNMAKDLQEEIQRIEKKNKDRETRPGIAEPEIEQEPPENFKLLSVIPTMQDLLDQRPYIRKCKVKDAYTSVEHYLDVQFRLLREDFISPLRNGINEYLYSDKKHRNQEVRVYLKVTLERPDISEKIVGFILKFGVIKSINWRRSKRFMYGGLLLLSSDNFKTVLFVTVANRDEKQLEKGYILIEPCEGTSITREMYKMTFVMLESKIYFEPYLAVLTAMQHMNEENFPMEPYLVRGDTTQRPPRYLEDADEEDTLRYKNWDLPVAYNEPWPTANEMGLDESQFRAFRCALTQDFAVIQGPPGTGKTFIALEIVRTLLTNEAYWKPYGPIVVVCLTNHALDQFLEGILKTTKSIVRVGSRSKSEVMKPYTLMERRKTVKPPRQHDAMAVMYETKHELETILSSMKNARTCIELLLTENAIVPLACLKKYSDDETLQNFASNEEFVKWLIGSEITLILLPEKPAMIQEQPEDDQGMAYHDDQDRHMDNDLELDYDFKVDESYDPIFPLKSLNVKILKVEQDLNEYLFRPELRRHLDATEKLRENLTELLAQRTSLQRKLAQHPLLHEQRHPASNSRWKLYWHWVTASHLKAMNQLAELEREYQKVNAKLNEVKQLVDLDVLREHDIVGLTTTGAAKLHASLRALKAPIVLVEEAAEILEAHVVCSMTSNCQHAILIGDHKQLRPKASVYKLGKDFNLNISLFERMVNLRGDCAQLAHQHRMRPQFAKLLTPSIYETLYNHSSVNERQNIKGMMKNLFFLHHENHESSQNNEESYANKHESEFLVVFARHLILQGYDPSEITILCTYTGQLFSLMKETDRYAILKRMRVTTVDNFQGEENKIILLSLVRNNEEGNIGFLKEENRVCVALSRARDGMYIMGNIHNLVMKNTIWPKIKKVLEEENAIGNALEFQCQIHHDQITLIQDVKDFQKCPEGGCSRKCELALACGHTCTSVCHILDREHLEYRCKQPCIKSCPNDHPCPLKCWEGCQPCKVMVKRKLVCGHIVDMWCFTDPQTFPCNVQVEATLPDCNHVNQKPCHLPIKDVICTYACKNRLPCGHVCRHNCHVNKDPEHIEYKCFKDCTRIYDNCEGNHKCKKRCYEECGLCPIIVAKTRSCGHRFKQFVCSKNVEEIECDKPCKRKLSCDHKCPSKCREPCGSCQLKVEKMSPCNHMVEVKCSEEPTPSKCSGKCRKLLPCGHPCTNKCKEACTSNCKVLVKLGKPALCGHSLQVPCYLQKTDPNSRELLKYCKAPCIVELECKHLCKGTCGSCLQGRIHINCAEPCNNILICGHQCEVACRLDCQPCSKKCELKCSHSVCDKKCGIPCVPCKEKCTRGCKHRQCSKLCSELCDIEPCNEPCQNLLKCEHPCVGLCGDPCPPLCRICDKEELTEVFFGDEDEPDARFVFLEDCQHCIESNALTKWMEDSNEGIQMKACPRCKTPIRKCMRLMNQIKRDLEDVLLVKDRVFSGNSSDLEKKRLEYVEALSAILSNPSLAEFPELKEYVADLLDRGLPIKNQRPQTLSSQEIEAFRILLDIMSRMLKILSLVKSRSVTFYRSVKEHVVMLVEALPTRWQISPQKITDIQLELQRLNYMVELCKEDYIYNTLSHKKEFGMASNKLLSFSRFTDKLETEVRKDISGLQHLFAEQIKIERQMIHKAMGYKQGHWYKCPNGHIYMITECGGAMEVGKCNECGAQIGGSQHRLLNSNTLATEMDGATRPAWPQGPNDYQYM
ncbi:PREDICTED: NFX1-type zinc finger-containing protein 1-like isoform X2 [Rhagoletis zephyria]|uniref:NFX1-type zinc finger-containing protein 1-like isoform X2 n=1 Tax=Rhagoletis zephyria TaxID=28612 RepID=UPI0008115F28|nr:PREDICTED: NFX1-type zinc finger-containing protein 1-like isoform X2 [Rhagoletis zephyria]